NPDDAIRGDGSSRPRRTHPKVGQPIRIERVELRARHRSPRADVSVAELHASDPGTDADRDGGGRARLVRDLVAEDRPRVHHARVIEPSLKVDAGAPGPAPAQLPPRATDVVVRGTPDELKIGEPEDHSVNVGAVRGRFGE